MGSTPSSSRIDSGQALPHIRDLHPVDLLRYQAEVPGNKLKYRGYRVSQTARLYGSISHLAQRLGAISPRPFGHGSPGCSTDICRIDEHVTDNSSAMCPPIDLAPTRPRCEVFAKIDHFSPKSRISRHFAPNIPTNARGMVGELAVKCLSATIFRPQLSPVDKTRHARRAARRPISARRGVRLPTNSDSSETACRGRRTDAEFLHPALTMGLYRAFLHVPGYA
jgi:hypothetical protein